MRREKGAILFAMIPLFLTIFITTGVYVFNSSRETINTASSQMSDQERSLYNAKIEKYIGESRNGTDIKLLIDEIISNNTTNIGEEGKFIGIEYISNDNSIDTLDLEFACIDAKYDNSKYNVDDATEEMRELRNQISSTKKYDVSINYESGYVTEVTITEN